MKMKNQLLYVPMAMTVMSVLVITNSGLASTTKLTTGTSGLNLNGKMFTLSRNKGGISFYPPYSYPSTTSYTTTHSYYPKPTSWTPEPATMIPARTYYTTPRPYRPTTRPYRPTTRPYPYTTRPWTSAPPTKSVSVCLRYLADYVSTLFTLSPSSRRPLKVQLSSNGYVLTLDGYGYYTLNLQPNIKFWYNIGSDIWTRVCITVDSRKNVAQVFSGSNISIRKILPIQYAWSGKPEIDFSDLDGQVTDIQIWDHPLRYTEVFNYMTSGVYGTYSGSVLSWSYISYSPRGTPLLEDAYEWQAKQPIDSSRGRTGRRPNGAKKTRKSFKVGKFKREQL